MKNPKTKPTQDTVREFWEKIREKIDEFFAPQPQPVPIRIPNSRPLPKT